MHFEFFDERCAIAECIMIKSYPGGRGYCMENAVIIRTTDSVVTKMDAALIEEAAHEVY